MTIPIAIQISILCILLLSNIISSNPQRPGVDTKQSQSKEFEFLLASKPHRKFYHRSHVPPARLNAYQKLVKEQPQEEPQQQPQKQPQQVLASDKEQVDQRRVKQTKQQSSDRQPQQQQQQQRSEQSEQLPPPEQNLRQKPIQRPQVQLKKEPPKVDERRIRYFHRLPDASTETFKYPHESLNFTKVIVPSIYDEFDLHGVPAWYSDPSLAKRFGYTIFRYQRMNASEPNYVRNRGTEGAIFLRYVVDHYDHFPDIAIFVHANPAVHNKYWLEMIGCIRPNATYFNFNDEEFLRRDTAIW